MNYIEVIKQPENEPVKLYNIIDPVIEEEINGAFTLNFSSLIGDDSSLLMHGAEIEVDGERFDISGKTKARSGVPKLVIECDHISYRLSKDNFLIETEEYETNPRAIMESLVAGSDFNIKLVEFLGVYYFRPKAETARGRLLELANFVGGEMVWNNLDISLVVKRGVPDGANFETGINIKTVQENIKTMNGRLERSLEVEIIDFSNLPGYAETAGYAEIKTINMGDSVGIKDNELEIDTRARVVRRQYNPFKKFIPQISVGRVIPNILEYFRDEVEEKEKPESVGVALTFRGSGALSLAGNSGGDSAAVIFSGSGSLSAFDKSKESKGGTINFRGSGSLSADMSKIAKNEVLYFNWIHEWLFDSADMTKAPGLDMTERLAAKPGALPRREIIPEPAKFITVRIPQDKLDDYRVEIECQEGSFDDLHFRDGKLLIVGAKKYEGNSNVMRIKFKHRTGPKAKQIRKIFAVDIGARDKTTVEIDEEVYIEYGRATLADEMTFMFDHTDGYKGRANVTFSLMGKEPFNEPVNIVFKGIYENDRVVGVKGMSNFSTLTGAPALDVSIMAICNPVK